MLSFPPVFRDGSFQDSQWANVIYLSERRAENRSPSRPADRPAFFFDVSCPLSYLTAERVERTLGEVEWIPVDGRGAARRAATPCVIAADARARALRLPLVWPDRFPDAARCAQRAAAFACEIGAGAARSRWPPSRLAFCGGFDLEDPETLAEAAAAAGVPLEECLKAAGESWRDEELEYTAAALRDPGRHRAARDPGRRSLVSGRDRPAGGQRAAQRAGHTSAPPGPGRVGERRRIAARRGPGRAPVPDCAAC